MSKPLTTDSAGDGAGSLRRLKRAIAPVTPQGWELDARDWADTLWLAQFMEPAQAGKSSKDINQDKVVVADGGVVVGTDISSSVQSVSVVVDNSSANDEQKDDEPTKREQESEGIPFPMPAADALRSRLDLARALRPLMRKVPSRSRSILDEAATVERTAEMEGLMVMPMERPQPERWLDLELVVEDSKTTVIWERAIAELQQLMEYQGAFRTVRTWRLGLPKDGKGTENAATDLSADLQLFPRWNERQELRSGQRPHNPRELVDQTGRRLIVLVTDATSEFWQRGLVHKPLELWTKQQPVVIVQMLPKELWPRTALADGEPVQFSALEPGMPNSRLVTHGLEGEWDGDDDGAMVPVPVVTLEKEALEDWARVVAGCGDVWVPGRSFEAGLSQVLAADFVRRQPVEQARQQRRTARQRVDLFRSTASPLAQQLAGVMAAAPVSLPVIDLLRQEFVPDAQQHHVAEVLLSGILRRCDDPDDAQCRYEFFGDEFRGQEDTSEQQVRMLLLDGQPSDQSYKVLGQLSALITGDSLTTFEAFLEICDENPESLGEGALPLARVGLSVLEQLGGRYGRIARQFKHVVAAPPVSEPVLPVAPPETPPEEEFPLIEIEDETAEIAAILDSYEFMTVQVHLVDLPDHYVEELPDLGTDDEVMHVYVGDIGSDDEAEEEQPRREDFQPVVVTRRHMANWGYLEELGEGCSLGMMEIPGGSFLIGSPESEPESQDRERPQREITLEPFYMGRFPVTQGQWRMVAGYDREERDLEPDPSSFKGDDLPVESVSWDDAVEFCKRLSRHTGKNYQLPSEAQWEYACRAGTTTPFWWGEGIVTELANYNGNAIYNGCPKGVYLQETTSVRQFPANPWGLHDTHGNVWEWCADHYGSDYSQIPADGSPWVDSNSTSRQLRGGSWYFTPRACRSAYRFDFSRVSRDHLIGFRVCCVPPRAL